MVIYISGHVRDGWPAMLTPAMGQQPPAAQRWAADTGCFANPEAHDDARYLAWLAALPLERCYFATAPDRFGDAVRTLEVAVPMLPRLRDLGVPAALVAQPTMLPAEVPWELVDVLFVGGPNVWQHGPQLARLVEAARARGKWVHVGRVNGYTRLRWAASIGAQSVDGTFLAYGPDQNERRLRQWLRRLEEQPVLVFPPRTEVFA